MLIFVEKITMREIEMLTQVAEMIEAKIKDVKVNDASDLAYKSGLLEAEIIVRNQILLILKIQNQ